MSTVGASRVGGAQLADDERIALAERHELGLAARAAHELARRTRRRGAGRPGSPSPVEIDGIRSQSSRFASSASSMAAPYFRAPARRAAAVSAAALYSRSVSAGPSLYRRHRPRTFADVVGQEHVVRTLSNAIEQDKVHHAYLFVGSRGTGKTSMAKILAACLNCERGPTIEPCGVCASCVAIASATSMDVIEMDAASQQLRRRHPRRCATASASRRSPAARRSTSSTRRTCSRRRRGTRSSRRSRSRRRSTIFVLATTEAQKVLPTVVDRCHRFDFGRPTVEQLVDRAAPRRRPGVDRDRPGCASRCWPATRPARSATRSARSSSSSPTRAPTIAHRRRARGARRRRRGPAVRRARRGRRARCARRAARRRAAGRHRPRPARSLARPRGARARPARRADARRACRRELQRDPRPRRAPERAGRAGCPSADVVRLLDLLAAALRADEGRRRRRAPSWSSRWSRPRRPRSTRRRMALLNRIARLEAALQQRAGRGGAPPAPAHASPRRAAAAARAGAEPPRRARDAGGAPAAAPARRRPRLPRRAPCPSRPPSRAPPRARPTSRPRRGRRHLARRARDDRRRLLAARRRARATRARSSSRTGPSSSPSRRTTRSTAAWPRRAPSTAARSARRCQALTGARLRLGFELRDLGERGDGRRDLPGTSSSRASCRSSTRRRSFPTESRRSRARRLSRCPNPDDEGAA